MEESLDTTDALMWVYVKRWHPHICFFFFSFLFEDTHNGGKVEGGSFFIFNELFFRFGGCFF